MIVTDIALNEMATVVTVMLDGAFGRNFPAATFKESDVEGFVSDAERAASEVARLRLLYVKPNVVPFKPKAVQP